jgi:hypothetical protein
MEPIGCKTDIIGLGFAFCRLVRKLLFGGIFVILIRSLRKCFIIWNMLSLRNFHTNNNVSRNFNDQDNI